MEESINISALFSWRKGLIMGEELFFEIVRSVLAPVATAVATFLITKLRAIERQRQTERELTAKMKKEQTETTEALKESMKVLLRRTIKEDCEEYLKRGFCSVEEREELEEAYILYSNFGGNHTIPQYMKRVDKLPFNKQNTQ